MSLGLHTFVCIESCLERWSLLLSLIYFSQTIQMFSVLRECVIVLQAAEELNQKVEELTNQNVDDIE